jgi:hypothetical protein
MTSVAARLNKDKLEDRDEFWQATKNARSFPELVTALKRFQGFQSNAIFQVMFKKCLEFTGAGFVLIGDFAVWRKILAALADDDGIIFVFQNGLMIEFHQDKGGKVRMHIFTAGEGDA